MVFFFFTANSSHRLFKKQPKEKSMVIGSGEADALQKIKQAATIQ